MGLLIWAWAALHLSQQEQHTKQAAKNTLSYSATHKVMNVHYVHYNIKKTTMCTCRGTNTGADTKHTNPKTRERNRGVVSCGALSYIKAKNRL